MAAYDPPPRSRRDARPRYYDDGDDASDEESYAPPRRNRRPPPTDSDIPPPPAPHPHRASILINPDETASQRDARRRSRSIDKVRLQTDSSDDEYGGDRRRGPPKPRLSRRPSHDLERKTTDENKKFRNRRDDYESDEGETLRKSKRSSDDPKDKPRRRDYDDYDDDAYRPEKKDSKLDRFKDKLSLRGKPRAPEDRDDRDPPPYEYGAAPIASGAAGAVAGAATGAAVAAARPRLRGYDTDPERPRARPQTWGEDDFKRASGRDRERDRYDDDGYERRPRPRPRFEDDPEVAYASGGRSGGRRDRYDDGYDDYRRRDKRDDGYRSDRDRRGGLAPPRPKYDAYYSDSREDRAYPRPRDRDRDDRRSRADYYDSRDRDRYRDDYYGRDRRDRDRRGKNKSEDWQKQAGVLFTTYALPVIKREGTKFVKKELQNFLQKRGG